MGIADYGPWVFSGIVGILTAYLSYKRATKVHKDTYSIDKQRLINETYEQIMVRLNEELDRRSRQYDEDRRRWQDEKTDLKEQNDNLKHLIIELQREVRRLKDRELKTEVVTQLHLQDEHRHTERREAPRIQEGQEDGEGSY